VGDFEAVSEQHEAKRLLSAALAERPAHAYLLHGPSGVGKRDLALLFAAELLGDHARVERRSHPDLYVLEPLGDQIRIDDIRELRRDLHMRPFEASRRVYLVFGADTMNEDAADALLKDLEEPPPYAVMLLVADDLGPLPETIRSRCQLIPFRRLSEAAVREAVRRRAPELADEEVTTVARVAGGRLDRAERLLDAASKKRREELLAVARAVYLDPEFDTAQGAETILAGIGERGAEAKEHAEGSVAVLELTGREAEQRVRRAQRGAERDELLAVLEELEWWYRDLVVAAAGAEGAVVHVDRLAELRVDATRDRSAGAEDACEAVREAWRTAEELQVSMPLAVEALLVRLRRAFAGAGMSARAAS
jgi:DNA polymerase III subunit delta'